VKSRTENDKESGGCQTFSNLVAQQYHLPLSLTREYSKNEIYGQKTHPNIFVIKEMNSQPLKDPLKGKRFKK